MKAISGSYETPSSSNTFNITLATDQVALFVWLEVDDSGYFSDNGFLMTEKELELKFFANQEATKESLLQSINVTVLTDTYSTETVAKARAEAVMDRALHPNDIKNLLFVWWCAM